jgi:hypothetical protein
MTQMSLEKRIERLEAVYEIQNLVSKSEYLIAVSTNPGMGERVVEMYARRDDVSICIGGVGMYKGYESIRKSYTGISESMSKMVKLEGTWADVALTTPVIEVAEDGKTAKGLWMIIGWETTRHPVTDKVDCNWHWDKYAADFIKEDGVWKLWHVNIFLTFFADFYKSWAEGGAHPSMDVELPPEHRAGEPCPFRFMPYDPNKKRELFPAFPEPYKTYDGNMDWIDPYKPQK